MDKSDSNHEPAGKPPGQEEWLRSNVAVSPAELRRGKPAAQPGRVDRGDKSDEKGERAEAGDKGSGDGEEPAGDDRKKRKKPWIAVGVVALLVIAGLAVGIPWYLHARLFESTDDAFVDAHYEKVAPQVAGRVTKVLVNDNQIVGSGDLLMEIDPSDYRAEVERASAALVEAKAKVGQQAAQERVAEANVAQARADAENARANRDNAYAQLKRYEGLSEDAKVQQKLDDLRTAARSQDAQVAAAEQKVTGMAAQVELAKAQVRAAEASVGSAQAQLDTANLKLSYCEVRATVAGKVTNRSVQVGDYVSVAQQVLLIVPHEVWVTANFKETQLTDMRPGQAVDLRVDAYPDVEFKGKVESIQKGSGAWFSLLPPENATGNYVKVVQRVPVKITFDDAGGEDYQKLGPGMSVVPKVRVR